MFIPKGNDRCKVIFSKHVLDNNLCYLALNFVADKVHAALFPGHMKEYSTRDCNTLLMIEGKEQIAPASSYLDTLTSCAIVCVREGVYGGQKDFT